MGDMNKGSEVFNLSIRRDVRQLFARLFNFLKLLEVADFENFNHTYKC